LALTIVPLTPHGNELQALTAESPAAEAAATAATPSNVPRTKHQISDASTALGCTCANLLRPNLLLLYALLSWWLIVVLHAHLNEQMRSAARHGSSLWASAALASLVVGTALNANAWQSEHEGLRAYLRRAPCSALRFYCVSCTRE
jgi:hypothetical protein